MGEEFRHETKEKDYGNSLKAKKENIQARRDGFLLGRQLRLDI